MSRGCVDTVYLTASYKGVVFEAIEVSSEYGRRGAIGEFPFGEDTAYADLGRRNQTYSFRARFAENSHLADVDALIEAVESPGSGPLVHPTRGVINAACKTMKVKDDLLEEQGVSFADLEFVEANDWPGGMSLVGSAIGVAVDLVIAAAEAVFTRDYVMADVPFHRRGAVRGTARNGVLTVRNEYVRANQGSTDQKVSRALADFDTIAADETLLDQAAIVKTAISGGIAATNAGLSGDNQLQAMRRVANSAAAASSLAGAAGTAQDAVYMLTRVAAGAYLGQAALGKRFANVDEALRYLDTATAVLVNEAELAYRRCDNDLFIELRRYVVSLQAQIYAKAYNLPGIVFYDFLGAVHPLVAAYHIYGDAKRHRELEEGNLIMATGRFNGMVAGAG